MKCINILVYGVLYGRLKRFLFVGKIAVLHTLSMEYPWSIHRKAIGKLWESYKKLLFI
tara:strand:+ start:780 stop:953 length:174 start_codon:yes stop_codon:yes gene_type:complete